MLPLRLAGPTRLRDTEILVQKIALAYEYEFVPRAWESERRSYFLRWRDTAGRTTIIGVATVRLVAEGGSALELVAFDRDASSEHQDALHEFRGIMQSELEEQRFFLSDEDSLDAAEEIDSEADSPLRSHQA